MYVRITMKYLTFTIFTVDAEGEMPSRYKKLLSLAPDSRFDICKRTFLLIGTNSKRENEITI